MKLTSPPVPIFRIFDVAKAKEFYVDYLGFQIDWEHRFDDEAPLYMQVSRAGFKIHLTEHHGDCTPGGAVFVTVSDIEDFHRELVGKRYRYLRPGLGRAPWNALCMDLIDPFGNRLRFNEDLTGGGADDEARPPTRVST